MKTRLPMELVSHVLTFRPRHPLAVLIEQRKREIMNHDLVKDALAGKKVQFDPDEWAEDDAEKLVRDALWACQDKPPMLLVDALNLYDDDDGFDSDWESDNESVSSMRWQDIMDELREMERQQRYY